MTVSSSAGYFATGIDFYAIADGPERAKYSELEFYGKSKFVRRTEKTLPLFFFFLLIRSQANVVVARELARRYGDRIVSTSLHPGIIRTDLQRHLSSWLRTILVRSFVSSSSRWLTLIGGA